MGSWQGVLDWRTSLSHVAPQELSPVDTLHSPLASSPASEFPRALLL